MKILRDTQILFFALMVTISAELTLESTNEPGQLMASRYQFMSPEMYLDFLKTKMSMNEKSVCPFGFPQSDEDLLAQIAEQKKQEEAVKPKKGKKGISLEDVVNEIPVNAVFAKRGVFFSGSRIIRKGEILKVIHNNESYNMLVSEVGSGGIIFRDVEREEQATKRLNMTNKKFHRKYDKSKVRDKLYGFSVSQKPLRIGGGN